MNDEAGAGGRKAGSGGGGTSAGTAVPAAFLFDFDMTVADTAESVIRAMNLFADEQGLRHITKEDLMGAIGLPLEDTWVKYWGRCEPGWPELYRERHKDTELSGFRPFPGTVALLDRLAAAGAKLAVVTNRWSAADAVEAAGLGGRFGAIVGAEESRRPKPYPDPVLKALELLGVPAEAAALAGDSDLDIKAACAAGVRGIGVATGGVSRELLAAAGAWKVCGEIGEIAGLFGLG
ncbi:MAG: HAD family hydrolase [Deltaproteobacteria bacterium]|jgi:HAD superfamily hydrolase (TIGR01509 family)|nr:HAD family hydrolase [Deltaproteobacteria bacterium]